MALVAGGITAALGACIYFGCVFEFASRGRGTPAFWDPPRRLILGPWFRLVRNPMYVGVALMIAGQGIARGSALTLAWALLVTVGFHVFVVTYEEPHLRRVFGREYLDYCTRVPRWLPVRRFRQPIRRLTSAAIWPTLRS